MTQDGVEKSYSQQSFHLKISVMEGDEEGGNGE